MKLWCEVEEQVWLISLNVENLLQVRNTGGRKKEEETVNFYDLLQTFLPATLK